MYIERFLNFVARLTPKFIGKIVQN